MPPGFLSAQALHCDGLALSSERMIPILWPDNAILVVNPNTSLSQKSVVVWRQSCLR